MLAPLFTETCFDIRYLCLLSCLFVVFLYKYMDLRTMLLLPCLAAIFVVVSLFSLSVSLPSTKEMKLTLRGSEKRKIFRSYTVQQFPRYFEIKLKGREDSERERVGREEILENLTLIKV